MAWRGGACEEGRWERMEGGGEGETRRRRGSEELGELSAVSIGGDRRP